MVLQTKIKTFIHMEVLPIVISDLRSYAFFQVFEKILFKGITHGGSLSILNKESYHYALSRDMAQ